MLRLLGLIKCLGAFMVINTILLRTDHLMPTKILSGIGNALSIGFHICKQ
jgi:hypothetical protein